MCLPTCERNRDPEAQYNDTQRQDVGGPVSNHQANGNPGQHGLPDRGSDPEPRMIGDFDGSANALWTLYGKEAKSHDEARIETLKDDMDGVLIFAGLFSAVLTAFIIDSKQNLKVNPTDQMVYYLQQNVAMLDQISRQISSITPQFSIPSTSPPAFPAFKPLASDIRVNVCWFMSLVFSLSAALLAILVQQWIRNYMQVFQRYSDPLKRGRVRQYLNEGLERWHMTVVAETVPCLLHVSLFLFFAGFCDFVLKINVTVGLSSSVPIAFTTLLYITVTSMPVINPQSPYRTSLSGLIWYLIQKSSRGRYRYLNSGGELRPVSSNMAERQMQSAMEEKRDRKGRDERAFRWLISNTSSDAEMDSLAMAIPGSFNGVWGWKVWTGLLNATQDEEGTSRNEASRVETSSNSIHLPKTRTGSDSRAITATLLPNLYPIRSRTHSTNAHGNRVKFVRAISASVARMLGRSREFASSGEWRMQMRTCIEMASILVCHAPVGGEIVQFGDITKPLGAIGDDLNMRVLSSMGSDRSFVVSWTCLSLVAIRPILESNWILHNDARQASRGLERRDNAGETRLQKIINAFNNASSCLESFAVLPVLGETEDRVKQILCEHEFQISKLEEIDIENAELRLDDWSISSVQQSIDQITHGVITRQLPGVKSDISDTESDDVSQFVELYHDPHTLLFISPLRNLRGIRSFAQTVRNILQGHDVDALQNFQKTVKDLREIQFPRQSDNLFHRQMWRLLDLQDGGLGFIVELFFLALKQLLSNPSSEESHSALYLGTFRAITSNWSEYKGSVGTQALLVNMVTPDHSIIFDFDYPAYIVEEFLAFMDNILEGQTGDHIEDVMLQLTDFSSPSRRTYNAPSCDVMQQHTDFPTYKPRHPLLVKVLGVISRSQVSSL